MNNVFEMKLLGKRALMTRIIREGGHPSPNFENTGLALVGFLNNEETVEQFFKRREDTRTRINDELNNKLNSK